MAEEIIDLRDRIEKMRFQIKQDQKSFNSKQSFPSVSLSVKNPVSSSLLVGMILLQILSNIGILYFLYIGLE